MKKYYARQVDPESFEWEVYLDEDLLVEDGIAICGNRDFCGLNADLINDLIEHLEDCYSDLYDLRVDYESEEISSEDMRDQFYSTIKYYFPETKDFDIDKLDELAQLCDEYDSANYRAEDDIIVKTLSLLKNTKYKVVDIRGCCQGDYNKIYCPETTTQEYIDYLEAVYFGTGTEYEITLEPIESEEEFDDAETYFDYTALYKSEDIKKWLSENINCKEEDIVVLNIESTYTVRHHTYTEI